MPVTEEQLYILQANNAESHLETRRCIKTAMIDLMRDKHFDDIRMTDIIRKIGGIALRRLQELQEQNRNHA